MNFEVHFSSAAQVDIKQIFDYISISLCSPIAAKNLMAKFQESVNTLSDFPDAFALCQDEPWILREVRTMPVGNYRLFYHVNHDKRKVVILRVFYCRQEAKQSSE